MKDNVSLPATFGADNISIEAPLTSRNCSVVALAISMSVNIAPKAVDVANWFDPGTKNVTSRTLLPTAVNWSCPASVDSLVS